MRINWSEVEAPTGRSYRTTLAGSPAVCFQSLSGGAWFLDCALIGSGFIELNGENEKAILIAAESILAKKVEGALNEAESKLEALKPRVVELRTSISRLETILSAITGTAANPARQKPVGNAATISALMQESPAPSPASRPVPKTIHCGRNLRRIRQAYLRTEAELAKGLNVPASAVATWENSGNVPERDLDAILNYFTIDRETLTDNSLADELAYDLTSRQMQLAAEWGDSRKFLQAMWTNADIPAEEFAAVIASYTSMPVDSNLLRRWLVEKTENIPAVLIEDIIKNSNVGMFIPLDEFQASKLGKLALAERGNLVKVNNQQSSKPMPDDEVAERPFEDTGAQPKKTKEGMRVELYTRAQYDAFIGNLNILCEAEGMTFEDVAAMLPATGNIIAASEPGGASPAEHIALMSHLEQIADFFSVDAGDLVAHESAPIRLKQEQLLQARIEEKAQIINQGKRIAGYRNALSIPMEKVCEETGIARETMLAYENGEKAFSDTDLILLAGYYLIDVAEFTVS